MKFGQIILCYEIHLDRRDASYSTITPNHAHSWTLDCTVWLGWDCGTMWWHMIYSNLYSDLFSIASKWCTRLAFQSFHRISALKTDSKDFKDQSKVGGYCLGSSGRSSPNAQHGWQWQDISRALYKASINRSIWDWLKTPNLQQSIHLEQWRTRLNASRHWPVCPFFIYFHVSACQLELTTCPLILLWFRETAWPAMWSERKGLRERWATDSVHGNEGGRWNKICFTASWRSNDQQFFGRRL